MAKAKAKPKETEFIDYNDAPGEEDTDPMAALNQDFSLDDEYKEPPLLRKSNYYGNVTKVGVDAKSHAIVFTTILEGNDGFQSDGSTPVDGQMVWYRVWLPKAVDANEMIKSGNMTKRQWKINNMKQVADRLGINMNTPDVIKEAIENGDWIGLRVLCAVDIREYQGVVSNEVTKMVAAEPTGSSADDDDIPF